MNSFKLIMEGRICPYCMNQTQYVDSSVVYGRSYGMIYLCKPCDAYVGVHKGTNEALGRLADKDLRFWKKEAHKYFDALWRRKKSKGARSRGYAWLAKQLKISPELCHIGMFDIKTCQEAVNLCKPYYRS